jgi:hypothetical protein
MTDATGDHGHRIAFEALERGVPVVSSDGQDVGTVKKVMIVHEKHLFDGIVVTTPAGDRFVDAPEVDEIFERLVTLKIDGDEAERLPEPPANPGALKIDARSFGGRGRRMMDRFRGR